MTDITSPCHGTPLIITMEWGQYGPHPKMILCSELECANMWSTDGFASEGNTTAKETEPDTSDDYKDARRQGFDEAVAAGLANTVFSVEPRREAGKRFRDSAHWWDEHEAVAQFLAGWDLAVKGPSW